MKKVSCLVLFLLFFLSIFCFAQTENTPFQAYKIQQPVEIDGMMDETAWMEASEANRLLFEQSDRSDPDSVQTSVKILFDENRLYVGFICRDSEPERIIADIQNQDGDIRSNDSVYLLIDPGSSQEFYYYFGVTPLSARWDGRISKTGFPNNPGWNGSWTAKARKTKFGWTAEIAVERPLPGIESTGNSAFRAGFSRVVPRLDNLFWSGPLDPAFRLEDPGLLKTIQLPSPASPLSSRAFVMPLARTRENAWAALGGDVKYNPSRRFSAHLAVLPEFDTVEPDEEQINLTLYEVRLPEKRAYFSGSRDLFRQPLELFYSRRIGQLYGGLRFQGKSGAARFAGISTQSDPQPGMKSANTSAFRITSPLLKGLTLGGTVSNKYRNQRYSGAAGADFLIDISPSILVKGQYAVSYGRHDENNSAYYVEGKILRPSFSFTLGAKKLGKSFRDNLNQVGFILDDDRQEIMSSIRKEFPFRILGLQHLYYYSDYDVYWNTEGVLRSWKTHQELGVKFKEHWTVAVNHMRDYYLNPYYPEELIEKGDRIFPGEWRDFQLSLGPLPFYDPDRIFHLFNPVTGAEYHFYKGRKHYHGFQTKVFSSFYKNENNNFFLSFGTGRFLAQSYYLFEAGKHMSFSQFFRVTAEIKRLQFDYEMPPAYKNVWLYMIKGSWDDQDDLRFDLFFQHNTRLNKMNLQLKCLYRILPPRGAVQVVLQRGLSPFGIPGTLGQAAYIKFIYSLI